MWIYIHIWPFYDRESFRIVILLRRGPFINDLASFEGGKGHLISKCLFGVFTFFQKTIEHKSTSSKIKFVCSFFERNVGLKKSFQICLTFSEGSEIQHKLMAKWWHAGCGGVKKSEKTVNVIYECSKWMKQKKTFENPSRLCLVTGKVSSFFQSFIHPPFFLFHSQKRGK